MELGKVLTAELDPRRFLKKLIQKVSELLPAENWSLLLDIRIIFMTVWNALRQDENAY